MPIPKFIKEYYYYIFNKYLRKHVSWFVLRFFDYYKYVIYIKIDLYKIIDLTIEDYVYRHICHNLVIGFFNNVLVWCYLSCIFCLYLVKEFIKKQKRAKIKRFLKKKKINIDLLIYKSFCHFL